MVYRKKVSLQTHVTLDSSEDEGFHDELGLRNAISLERALLLVGFLQRGHEELVARSKRVCERRA